MASKVNTKFVTFLVLAVCAAAMLIGGLYVLNVRTNAKRNIRLGQEALTAGDLRKARDYFGRAVSKEPGNLEYLAKVEEVTVQIRPRTADEARELYNSWLSLLHHAARHDSANPQRHLRLLQELCTIARRTKQQWQPLIEAGDEMWRNVSQTDPLRYFGKVYRSKAIFNRMKVSTLDEIVAAEQDMLEAVQHLPDSDLAWATLIHGQLVLADKWREQGRSIEMVQQQIDRARESIHKALQAVPNGVEVARMQLLAIAVQLNANPQSVGDEQIQAAAAHLEQALATQEVDPGLMVECVDLLPIALEDGAQRACVILDKYIQKHPDMLDVVFLLGSLSTMTNQLDQAERAAMRVIEAEQLPVGFLAQVQNDLRKQAAGLLVDIEGRRWANAAPDDRPAQVQRMEKARERLATFVADVTNDPQLLRADAKIAYTKGDYGRAAVFYERLVKETAFVDDAETLFFAAVSLEKINQIGRAHERVGQALQIKPGNPMLLKFKAKMELAMGRRADAASTLTLLPKSEMEAEDTRQLLAAISGAAAGSPDIGGDDPVASAIADANQAMVKGDITSARTTLNAALGSAPENLALLYAMTALEFRAGNQAAAKEYVARGLKVDPKNVNFLQWDSLLKHDNPVDAMREFHMTAIQDERERALSMLTGLKALAWQQDLIAQQQAQEGDTQAADKARAIATHARNELREWATRAEQLAPDDARLLEHLLDDATVAEDWPRAEQIVARARTVNADQAGGLFYKGRLELARAGSLTRAGKPAEARPLFQEAARNLESVTDRLGFHANAWKALAFAYSNLGNYTQAERAYEQAYKCNPNDLEGVQGYLDVLMRRGDSTRALRILRDAHQLAPNDPNIRHMWLKIEAEAGDRALALRTRRKLARENPDDVVNAAELAHLLSSTEPDRTTILDASGNPLYPEARWARMNAEERIAAIVQAKQDWYKESDAILERLRSRMGGDLRFAALQAHALRLRGEVAAGEEILKQFIAAQTTPTVDSLLELGRYQTRASHYPQAIATFTEAGKLQNNSVREADRELAQLYMQLSRFEQAIEHLKKLIEVSPERAYRNQLVECLLKLKRFDEAEAGLAAIVKEHGEDFMAALLSASITEARADELVKAGDTAAADRLYARHRDILNRAQTMEPLSVMPRLLLAQSLLKEYNRTKRDAALSDALNVLDDAEKARAGTAEVAMLRVAILRAKGDIPAATSELRRMVERYPDNHAARRDLADLYLQQKRPDLALAIVEDGIRANPTLAIWHEVAGDLYLSTRAPSAAAQALAAYIKAYDLTPSGVLLLKVTDATLATAEPDCRALLARYAAVSAADLDGNPTLREGYARALHCAKRKDEALEQLRQAYARRKKMIADGSMQDVEMASWFQAIATVFAASPGQVDASAAEQFLHELNGGSSSMIELRGLARLWANTGDPKLSACIERQLQAVKMADSVGGRAKMESYHELATFYFASGQYAEAAAAYETLLGIDPDRIEALNNFSYITAVFLNDPKKAIPYAERAVQLAPQQPSIIDTLGWAHYLAGNLDQARQYLQESLRIQESAPTLVHMAAVHLAMGELNAANQMLNDAARLNPDSETTKEITRIQEDIRKARDKSR